MEQNRYLPPGGTTVEAVVRVTTAPAAEPAPPPPAAEVVIVDTSGSMYGTKLAAAKLAACAAVDALRDGVALAVVAGGAGAEVVYPPGGGLAALTDRTRAAVRDAVEGLTAQGGTRMGAWLRAAGDLFAPLPPGTLKHAILLTDGQNNEQPATFEPVLAAAAGRFVCDCRGVGTDWNVEELRRVAAALLGTVGIIAEPARMPADFRAMAESAMAKTVADVALRLRTPRGTRVTALAQVAPTLNDLTARRAEADPRTGDYPTGSWDADESRDYHLRLEVPPGAAGRRMRAARVGIVVPGPGGGEATAPADVLAEWTADPGPAAEINPAVAHYTGQTELAQAIQEGLRARRDGDTATATVRLGRAVALAHSGRHAATAALLRRVVEVDDPATGTVRLRPSVAKLDEMTLDTHSTRTVRVGGRGVPAGTREGAAPPCG
ncbi:VWA domain-containing protein [Streptomonospora sp. NEAU-YY374]|uniref:VWA domain-containing protein n=1 Tax=Streptomonospora nanhaiensis TaxID=1323731 RepID=UPI0015C6F000|nr:VWA domain-containing protein [Streptomonospora nanhaiensis]MBV2365162.1 VWA domain-containing protein [Streptomonospora nanhaiensis]MBV2366333.1 VWA domain-containing protein [Streptomonospora nanhaiensis]MBX9391724.1 VWA domain-containing protein [Streptomonospora nanhaiensis]